MNRRRRDPSGSTGIPGRIAEWLQSLTGGRSSPSASADAIHANVARTGRSDLMQKAAECYARAGWADDACRVFEELGDNRHAAPFHEQQGRWQQAALCYARSGDWQSAARCHLRLNQPDEAAECLRKAGQTLQAAWVWANLAHHFRRAEESIQSYSPSTESDRLAVQLIIARCEVGTDAPTRAAKRLSEVIAQLRTLQPGTNFRYLYEWAFEVASALHRPDLTVHLHATATVHGLFNAYEQWEQWAKNNLGDSGSVPQREAWLLQYGQTSQQTSTETPDTQE